MPSRPPSLEGDYYYPADRAPQGPHAIWPTLRPLLPAPPCRVLEIGCGDGSLAAELVRLGHAVVGFDVSESGIAVAKKQVPDASFLRMSIYEQLPTDWRGRFDVVVSLETIEHLYLPGVLLQRSHEALLPDGMILLSTPYHGYLKNLALAVSGKFDPHFSVLWDYGHIKFFSKRTLTELLRRTGFEDIRFVGYGRVRWLWKSMIAVARKGPG